MTKIFKDGMRNDRHDLTKSALPPTTTSYNNYNLKRQKLCVDIFKKKNCKESMNKRQECAGACIVGL